MFTVIRLTLLASIISICCSHFVLAGAPSSMNYQGYLTDINGDPVADGSYSVSFTIYDSSVSGVSKWTETQPVTTSNGFFSILLGATNPIIDTVFNGTTRYLGVTVGSDPEISPRTALVSVPYAQRVSTVDGASGGMISGSTAVGVNNQVLGANSVAFGDGNTVSGDVSLAYGNSNDVYGPWSFAGGRLNTVSGSYSAAIGAGNNVEGHYSFAIGKLCNILHRNTFMWNDGDPFSSTAPYQFLINAPNGVGIGTNAPQSMLNLEASGVFQIGDTADAIYSQLSQNNLTFNRDFKSYISNAKNGYLVFSVNGLSNNNLVIHPSGKIGVGTDAPNYTLDVRGSIGNNSTLYHSDRRWKRDIRSLTGSLDKVMRLHGVSYKWKQTEYPEMNFPNGEQIGLIAQEVEKEVPEVVQTGTDGFKSVDYSKLVALLIEANKEQQKQIDSQQEQLTAQQMQIDELKTMMQNLVRNSQANSQTLSKK